MDALDFCKQKNHSLPNGKKWLYVPYVIGTYLAKKEAATSLRWYKPDQVLRVSKSYFDLSFLADSHPPVKHP
jgi:hypothetical protein